MGWIEFTINDAPKSSGAPSDSVTVEMLPSGSRSNRFHSVMVDKRTGKLGITVANIDDGTGVRLDGATQASTPRNTRAAATSYSRVLISRKALEGGK